MQSLFFEQLAIGMEWRTALSAPIAEDDIRQFAALTFDQVHFLETAGQPPRMLVQGNFVVSLSGGLLFKDPAHFTDTIRVQTQKYTDFVHPVFAGDSVYVVERVVALDGSVGKRVGEVVLERKTYNQNDVLVLDTFRQVYRIRKNPG